METKDSDIVKLEHAKDSIETVSSSQDPGWRYSTQIAETILMRYGNVAKPSPTRTFRRQYVVEISSARHFDD